MVCRTGGPPVDAPMASTWNFPAESLALPTSKRRLREESLGCSGRAYRVLSTFTSDIGVHDVPISLPPQRLDLLEPFARPAGFDTTAKAPAWVARVVVAASRVSALPLTITTGVGQVSMILRVASKPFILGRWMSMVMTSGF